MLSPRPWTMLIAAAVMLNALIFSPFGRPYSVALAGTPTFSPCPSPSAVPLPTAPTSLATEPPLASLPSSPPLHSLPTAPPNLPSAPPSSAPSPGASPSSPPCAEPSPTGDVQAAILAASQAFVGTSTCGLHGAPGDEACMASVNQILMNAGVAPLGPGEGYNYIPTAIQYGLSSGEIIEIAQADTVPGDLEVRHSPGDTYGSSGGDEHIAVCQTYGCTDVLSNASSSCTFGWDSDYTMCYVGSPYCNGTSQFYRVLN